MGWFEDTFENVGEFFGFGNEKKAKVNFKKQVDPYYQEALDETRGFESEGIKGLLEMANKDTSSDYRNMLKSDLGKLFQQNMSNIRQNTMGMSSGLRNQQMRQGANDISSTLGNKMSEYKIADVTRQQEAYGMAGDLESKKQALLSYLLGDRAQSAGNVAGANAANYANTMAGRLGFWGNVGSSLLNFASGAASGASGAAVNSGWLVA